MTFDTSLVSDLHKDAFGFRPREAFWSRWSAMTDAQKQKEWDSLLDAADASAKAEREQQDRCEAEADAEIANLRSLTGGTIEDAIRHLHQAYDTDGDDGFLEYHLGTRYGYIARKRSA